MFDDSGPDGSNILLHIDDSCVNTLTEVNKLKHILSSLHAKHYCFFPLAL